MALLIPCIFCLILAGFCVWKMAAMAERNQDAQENEQSCRMAEREAAWRREKFLIIVMLKNDPQLAEALSKMPASEKEPEEFMADLADFGEARLTRRP